jgi:hypothetical protein
MAVQYLTITGSSITDLANSANTVLAGLLDRAITRVEFEVIDDVRYRGREYRLILTTALGATPLAAQFIATGFEAATFDLLAIDMQAYANTIPAAFVSPAWTAIIQSQGRTVRRAAGMVFSCTDAAQAAKNWQAGGGANATGGGDHATLANRAIANQHPALAIAQDNDIALALGANVVDTVTAPADTTLTWDLAYSNGSGTVRASTLRAQLNGTNVVMQEFGITVDGAAAVPTADVTYAAGAFTLTITTPATGWSVRTRRNSLF